MWLVVQIAMGIVLGGVVLMLLPAVAGIAFAVLALLWDLARKAIRVAPYIAGFWLLVLADRKGDAGYLVAAMIVVLPFAGLGLLRLRRERSARFQTHKPSSGADPAKDYTGRADRDEPPTSAAS
jgi:hypothetical protein